MKRARRSLLLVAALLLVALPVLAACGGGGGNGGGGGGNGGASGNKYTVTAQNMSFDTNKIELKKGQTYTIELVNKDSVAHDLVSEELGLKVDLTDPNKSNSVQFTPEKTGEFEFICSVPGHSAAMNGTIVVTE